MRASAGVREAHHQPTDTTSPPRQAGSALRASTSSWRIGAGGSTAARQPAAPTVRCFAPRGDRVPARCRRV